MCRFGATAAPSAWSSRRRGGTLEREPPLRFGNGTETVETLEDFGEFHYDLAPGRRWSVGAYRVELRVDDVLAAQVPFRVAATTHHDGHAQDSRHGGCSEPRRSPEGVNDGA